MDNQEDYSTDNVHDLPLDKMGHEMVETRGDNNQEGSVTNVNDADGAMKVASGYPVRAPLLHHVDDGCTHEKAEPGTVVELKRSGEKQSHSHAVTELDEQQHQQQQFSSPQATRVHDDNDSKDPILVYSTPQSQSAGPAASPLFETPFTGDEENENGTEPLTRNYDNMSARRILGADLSDASVESRIFLRPRLFSAPQDYNMNRQTCQTFRTSASSPYSPDNRSYDDDQPSFAMNRPRLQTCPSPRPRGQHMGNGNLLRRHTSMQQHSSVNMNMVLALPGGSSGMDRHSHNHRRNLSSHSHRLGPTSNNSPSFHLANSLRSTSFDAHAHTHDGRPPSLLSAPGSSIGCSSNVPRRMSQRFVYADGDNTLLEIPLPPPPPPPPLPFAVRQSPEQMQRMDYPSPLSDASSIGDEEQDQQQRNEEELLRGLKLSESVEEADDSIASFQTSFDLEKHQKEMVPAEKESLKGTRDVAVTENVNSPSSAYHTSSDDDDSITRDYVTPRSSANLRRSDTQRSTAAEVLRNLEESALRNEGAGNNEILQEADEVVLGSIFLSESRSYSPLLVQQQHPQQVPESLPQTTDYQHQQQQQQRIEDLDANKTSPLHDSHGEQDREEQQQQIDEDEGPFDYSTGSMNGNRQDTSTAAQSQSPVSVKQGDNNNNRLPPPPVLQGIKVAAAGGGDEGALFRSVRFQSSPEHRLANNIVYDSNNSHDHYDGQHSFSHYQNFSNGYDKEEVYHTDNSMFILKDIPSDNEDTDQEIPSKREEDDRDKNDVGGVPPSLSPPRMQNGDDSDPNHQRRQHQSPAGGPNRDYSHRSSVSNMRSSSQRKQQKRKDSCWWNALSCLWYSFSCGLAQSCYEDDLMMMQQQQERQQQQQQQKHRQSADFNEYDSGCDEDHFDPHYEDDDQFPDHFEDNNNPASRHNSWSKAQGALERRHSAMKSSLFSSQSGGISWTRVSYFVVTFAPCFWVAPRVDVNTTTDRLTAKRLNIIGMFFALVQIAMGMFCAIVFTWTRYEGTTQQEELVARYTYVSPNLWNPISSIFLLGIVGGILVIAFAVNLATVGEASLVRLMRFYWIIKWVLPVELIGAIGLFGREYAYCIGAC
jgi:hypothetical protein